VTNVTCGVCLWWRQHPCLYPKRVGLWCYHSGMNSDARQHRRTGASSTTTNIPVAGACRHDPALCDPRRIQSQPVSIEYERRFIVKDTSVLEGLPCVHIEQGYVWEREGYAIRVRLVLSSSSSGEDDSCSVAEFALKGPRANASRYELENPLPFNIAHDIIRLSEFRIVKRRYKLTDETGSWIIDEFLEANRGLFVAEFESDKMSVQQLNPPEWVGLEITDDRRYDNEQLARSPVTGTSGR